MNQNWTSTRRNFLIKFGGGLGVLFGASLVGCGPIRRIAAEKLDGILQPYSTDKTPDIWFEITPENKIILKSPKVEMGQGLFTGLAMIAAEELQVNYEQIEVVHSSTNNGPVDPRSTGGSDSTFGLWDVLRELSANMRQMLLNNAAELTGVPANQLTAKDGIISGGGKQLTYGEIAAKATKWEEPKETPKLKSLSAFKVIGKEVARTDLQPKVTGAPIYGFDVNLPGMLYGMVVRKPSVDTEFVGADISEAERMPGVVKIVQEKDFVGVVADSKIAAINAHAAIKAEWKVNKVWQQTEIEEKIKVGKGKDYVIQKEGDAKSILKEEDVLTAEYTSPIGAHAQIEPNGAVADYKDGKIDIYISTQVAKITQDEVAKRLKIDAENVNVHTTFLGGGFGRRLHTPNAMQAAVLSKAVGKPVHCFFSRKEEFQNDMFRPPTHHVLRAKLNADGVLEAFEHQVSSGMVAFGSPFIPGFAEPVLGADFGAWRGGLINYNKIPHYRAVSWKVELPFATSWWRGLGLMANSFAIESFMDEVAFAAKKDPIAFRLAHIKNEEAGTRLIKVIEAARDKSNWGRALPAGHFQGFACSTDAQTPVAQIAEVSVENGEIKIHKVTCVIDPGIAINPDGIRAQCEGAIIMGISACMFEKMTIKDSVVQETIYGPYKMALMKHAPKEIDVVILENNPTPTGVGEPPMGPIGAAIANAIFAATGKRLRNLPLAEELERVS